MDFSSPPQVILSERVLVFLMKTDQSKQINYLLKEVLLGLQSYSITGFSIFSQFQLHSSFQTTSTWCGGWLLGEEGWHTTSCQSGVDVGAWQEWECHRKQWDSQGRNRMSQVSFLLLRGLCSVTFNVSLTVPSLRGAKWMGTTEAYTRSNYSTAGKIFCFPERKFYKNTKWYHSTSHWPALWSHQ